MPTPRTPFFLYLFALLACLSASGCRNRQIRILIDSDGADNSGYTAYLTTWQDNEIRTDTLAFSGAGQQFAFTFAADSVRGGYISVGNFEQYYPLLIGDQKEIRYRLEIASPHNSYDMRWAGQSGYAHFLKQGASLLRSYDKAVQEQDQEQIAKDSKLLAQQFITFASELGSRERKRLRQRLDWGIDIVAAYPRGLSLLRRAVGEGEIDSMLFSAGVRREVLMPHAKQDAPRPVLRAISRGDTILWSPDKYPEGAILIGCGTDWSRISCPEASAINLLIPIGATDSLSKYVQDLPPHTYIADEPEPVAIRVLRHLVPDMKTGVSYYRADTAGGIVIDSTAYFTYR